MNKVELHVLGFSFTRANNGTFGLVLSDDEHQRRLLVVVGSPEAHSIAFVLQGSSPPRPLTHDVVNLMLESFDIELEEAFIYKSEGDSVLLSQLIFSQQGKRVVLEVRTSDAIAIALRCNAPIYTTDELLEQEGIRLEIEPNEESTESASESWHNDEESLKKELQNAIDEENYELASQLRDQLSNLNLSNDKEEK